MSDQDPLAGLGPVAVAAPDSSDPLANMGPAASAAPAAPTAPAPPPSLGDFIKQEMSHQLGETGADVMTGAAKGLGDTVSGVSHLINKIPVVGETLAPKAGIGALDQIDTSTNTAQKVGKVGEAAAEFWTGDAALKGLGIGVKLAEAAAKYPKAAFVLDMAAHHPWLAKIITEGAKGATVGGAEGAVKGAQQDQAVKGGVTGAEVGAGVGAGMAAVSEGASALARNNPFRRLQTFAGEAWHGKVVAQAPAESAVREGVAAGTPTGGSAVPVGPPNVPAGPLLSGNETILDEPLKILQGKEKAAYNAVDSTVGFDLKEAKLQLKNDQYNLAQLGNTPADQATRKTLTASIADSQARVAQAESKLTTAGIDPKAADALHTARMAGQDFKKLVVRNTAPDGTINIDNLLKSSKMLRFTKYGDRLAQFMGKDAADSYMADLESAQKAGIHAMKTQALAKWIGTRVAIGLGIGAGAGLGLEAAKTIAGE